MAGRVQVLIANWKEKYLNREGATFDICSEMSRLTLDNIGIASFGGHFGAIDSDVSLYDDVAYALREMQKRAEQLYPVYQYYPQFIERTYIESLQKIKDIVSKKIDTRRKLLEQGDAMDSKRFLLDMMLESQKAFNLSFVLSSIQEYNLSDQEIVDEMVTWVMGGHETTASLLSWSFYLLDKHPDIQQKVIQVRGSLKHMVIHQGNPRDITGWPGVDF